MIQSLKKKTSGLNDWAPRFLETSFAVIQWKMDAVCGAGVRRVWGLQGGSGVGAGLDSAVCDLQLLSRAKRAVTHE